LISFVPPLAVCLFSFPFFSHTPATRIHPLTSDFDLQAAAKAEEDATPFWQKRVHDKHKSVDAPKSPAAGPTKSTAAASSMPPPTPTQAQQTASAADEEDKSNGSSKNKKKNDKKKKSKAAIKAAANAPSPAPEPQTPPAIKELRAIATPGQTKARAGFFEEQAKLKPETTPARTGHSFGENAGGLH